MFFLLFQIEFQLVFSAYFVFSCWSSCLARPCSDTVELRRNVIIGGNRPSNNWNIEYSLCCFFFFFFFHSSELTQCFVWNSTSGHMTHSHMVEIISTAATFHFCPFVVVCKCSVHTIGNEFTCKLFNLGAYSFDRLKSLTPHENHSWRSNPPHVSIVENRREANL